MLTLDIDMWCLCELQEMSGSREKRTAYQCMWHGCCARFYSCDDVESHVRLQHLSYVTDLSQRFLLSTTPITVPMNKLSYS